MTDDDVAEAYDRCVSLRDEDQYWDEAALEESRYEFQEMNRQIVRKREIERIKSERERRRLEMEQLMKDKEDKTVDFEASMHILDDQSRTDDEALYLEGPLFSLQDVMGEFEADRNGHFVIIRNNEG